MFVKQKTKAFVRLNVDGIFTHVLGEQLKRLSHFQIERHVTNTRGKYKMWTHSYNSLPFAYMK